jgi:glyoxylase-like metal-dependent hydrolase (beta-lactamase superfamily II)
MQFAARESYRRYRVEQVEHKPMTSPWRRRFRRFSESVVLFAGVLLLCTAVAAQNAQPLVSASRLKRVSDHVYVIMGFPNIGIVVGNRATLVIDTGLGSRNGATVLRVAEKLAKGPALYLTTTHFHPEHASGAQAFPASTVLIRPRVQ